MAVEPAPSSPRKLLLSPPDEVAEGSEVEPVDGVRVAGEPPVAVELGRTLGQIRIPRHRQKDAVPCIKNTRRKLFTVQNLETVPGRALFIDH